MLTPQIVFAYSDYIVAGGENIGLEITNKGIIVAGFYKVEDTYPGHDANLMKGDIITGVNNIQINSINEFIDVIKTLETTSIKVDYIRDNIKKNTTLNLIKSDGVLKTGLYVKDMVSGIGTLTFIDPNTKLFGALGHEVLESSSGVMLDVKDGKIYYSKVNSIDKSIRGEPGAKNASVDQNNVFGTISENTKVGVFGTYLNYVNNNKLYKVAKYKDIKVGDAKIVTVLNGDDKKEYNIKILSINNDNKDYKNILFEITDKNLIDKSGGIVQGMSGSPIIQDGYIVGAVTNVVINNPLRGYGVLITTMLEEAEN